MRRRNKLHVDTFPFLAVLLCAMGSLILILLVMDRRARRAALARGQNQAQQLHRQRAEAVAGISREHARKQAAATTAWNKKRAELKARLDAEQKALDSEMRQVQARLAEIARELRQEDDVVGKLRQTAQAEQTQLARHEQALQTAQKEAATLKTKLTVGDRARHKLAADLVQLEQVIHDLQAARQRDAMTYSVIPYKGKNGEGRRPLYVECTGAGLVFHPERFELRDPSLSALREEITRRVARIAEQRKQAGLKEERPYLMMLVRPEGIERYYQVQGAIHELPIEFGYEFVDAEWVLTIPTDPPQHGAATAQARPTPGSMGLDTGTGANGVDGGALLNGTSNAGSGSPSRGPSSIVLGGIPGGSMGEGRNGTGSGSTSGGRTGLIGNSTGGTGLVSGSTGGSGLTGGTGLIGGSTGGTGLTGGTDLIGGSTGNGGPGMAGAPGGIAAGGNSGPGLPGRSGGITGGASGTGMAGGPGGIAGTSRPGALPGSPAEDSEGPSLLGGMGQNRPQPVGGAPAPGLGGGSQGSSLPGGVASGSGAGTGTPNQDAPLPGAPGKPLPPIANNPTMAKDESGIPIPSLVPGPGIARSGGAGNGSTSPSPSSAPGAGVASAGGSGNGATSGSPGSGAASAGGSGVASAGGSGRGSPSSSSGSSGAEQGSVAVQGSRQSQRTAFQGPSPAPVPASRPNNQPLLPARISTADETVIFIECLADGVVVYPSRRSISIDSLNHSPMHNALYQIVKAQLGQHKGDPKMRHIRFLIHRDAERTFHLAYPALNGVSVDKTRYTLQPDDDVARLVATE